MVVGENAAVHRDWNVMGCGAGGGICDAEIEVLGGWGRGEMRRLGG